MASTVNELRGKRKDSKQNNQTTKVIEVLNMATEEIPSVDDNYINPPDAGNEFDFVEA